MGSKMPPPARPAPDEPAEDEAAARPPPPDGSVAGRLLSRIADALQVPPATLYDPPNAVGPSARPDGRAAGGLDGESAALVRAFARIRDPEERRRILALVQAAAERG